MIDLSLLQDFIPEAGEHLAEMESGLLQLETDPDNRDVLNDIFRSVHTIKGAAEFVGLERISELSHKLENLLDLLRQGKKQANRDIIDTLIEAKDRITLITDELESSRSEETLIDDLSTRITQLTEGPEEYDAKGHENYAVNQVSEEEPEEISVENIEEAIEAAEQEIELEALEMESYEEKEASGEEDEDISRETAEGEEAVEVADQDIEPEDLEIESYEEEHDKELFDIFIQQLKENISFLKSQTDELSVSDNTSEVLERCADSVESLKSSANYMGYQELVVIYKNWGDKIDEAKEELSVGNEISFDFMNAYADKILRIFPQTGELEFKVEEAAAPIEGEALPFVEELEAVPSIKEEALTSIEEPEAADPAPGSQIDLSLLSGFITEAGEHLAEMESGLLHLETNPDDRKVLNDIFRAIHTIKGSAGFVGLERISELSHKLENLLDLLRQGKKKANRDIIETLIEAKDRISLLTGELERSQSEETLIDDLVSRISQLTECPEEYDAEGPEDDAAKQVCEEEPEEISVEATEKETVDVVDQEIEPEGFEIESYEEEEASGEEDEDISRETAEGEEAVEVADQDIEPEDLEIESYEEEHDKELFDIFIQQLKENISFLKSQTDELSVSDNKIEVLERCADSVESLKSSANYMGYQELIAIYKNWGNKIDEAKKELSAGNEISFDFMSDYVDKILRIFPKTGELEFEVEEAAAAEEEDLTSIEELEAVPEAAEFTPGDKGLFDRLGKAFDASMEQSPDDESEVLPGVIEDMLFSRGEAAAPKQPSVEPAHGTEPAQAVLEESDIDENKSLPPDLPSFTTTEDESARKEVGAEKEIPEHLIDRRKIDQRITERRKSDSPGDRIFKQSMRVSAEKIDSLMNQVGELVVSRAFFSQLSNDMRDLQQHLKEDIGLDQKNLKQVRSFSFKLGEAIVSLGRVANDLQEGVMKVRMLPVSQLFNRYPRLVRDLTHNTDKQVQLEIRGEDTELDKMIIEEISDPLIHIIRNAVDHGFESTEERKRLGKPPTGELILEAFHESNHIVIEITDNGRGIDPARIRARALEKGFLSKEELDRMTDKELMRIIMFPGFSTTEKVTHTSGRGVGMDVVKKNVEKLNGIIEIDSTPGVKTQIRVKIPLTLAIIQALMVRIGENLFTVPLSTVEETLRISEAETSVIEGVEVIHLRDRTMPIFRLSEMFNIDPDKKDSDRNYVVIVSTGMQQIGLVVDELMGQEEVVIKPLVDYLQEKSGFSGATIIGDGKISLILDVYELVSMTVGRQTKRQKDLLLQRIAVENGRGNYQSPVTVH